jgi:very-long-chain ceramide synthase
MQTSPYANLNTRNFWVLYPHDAIPGLTKWYYLVQTAFWVQQILVIHMEKRRSDHNQMLTHHIITIVLLGLSYLCNFTRVGNAICTLMDFCDILLPVGPHYLSKVD